MVPECRPIRAVAALAVLLALQMWAGAGPFVFSLDNRPRAPIGQDAGVFGSGNGAEDPFGLVPTPLLVGPSPSLDPPGGPPLSDADILSPGPNSPVVNTSRPQNTNYIDAISSNAASESSRVLRLAFSVDRASTGVVGSAVHEQYLLNQHPGDIFLSERAFPAPGSFVGALPPPIAFSWAGFLPFSGTSGSNSLLLNQSRLKLTAGEGPGSFTESTDLAPPILPGTHDHVDAFDLVPFDTSGDHIGDQRMYFSVNPDQPNLSFPYISAASIYRTEPHSSVPVPFAPATSMGLDWFGIDNKDDVDALIVYDKADPYTYQFGTLNPGLDFALFSLSPGSEMLRQLYFSGNQVTAADVFFTDFQGTFATFATDHALGLDGTVFPAPGAGSGSSVGSGSGSGGSDNNSGMDRVELGDMDWNGYVELCCDVDDFVQGLTRPDLYEAELSHLGLPADVGDFSAPRDGVDFDDIPPFRALFEGGPEGSNSLRLITPEPAMVSLTTIAFFWLLSMRAARHSLRRPDSRCGPPKHYWQFDVSDPGWRAVSGSALAVRAIPRQAPRTIIVTQRRAYTLIEMLVVITIIGVLSALLMPAIQRARETARSAQCANHLKQLVLALHGYQGTHNRFPPGSTLASREDLPGDSWHNFCLAYLEEQEIADRLLDLRENIAPPIPIFFCPSDSVVTGGANVLHFTNYCGSAGAGRHPDYVIDLEDKFCGDVYTDGVLYPLSKTDDDSITDGLTHTLAIGERTYFKHIWSHGDYWRGSADRQLCLRASKNVRWPINPPAATSGYYVRDLDAPSIDVRTLTMNDLYFGSRHPDGAWFAFAGGNVHLIADDIAFSVYQDLATRNGGEQLPSEDGR